MSIKKSSTQLAANSNTPVLHFNFSKYEDVLNKVCHNNAEVVDFVTANGSLYVCAVDGTKPTKADINEQEGFLLIIKHGEDGSKGEQGVPGIPGVSPNISVRFNGRVLQILEDGTVVASSADLTGPAWRPVLNGTKLSWERSRDFDRTPQSIDLEELRPIDAKPLLLRVDSDNTKRADEVSGPARFIQWKHEGDKEWTNLIAINELMNLALAGVSFWQDENDHKWHFGHRQVIQAEYTSDSKGQQIISHVELGDVFYDAGPIDIANIEIDVQNILNRLTIIEGELRNIPSLNGYATEEWVNNQGFLKTAPAIDAYTKQQSDAKYQPKGNYLTDHQSLKTINGNSLVGTGDITISVGETSLFNVRFDSDSHKLQKTVDGQNWTDLVDLDDFAGSGGGMTEAQVKTLIGNILEGLLDQEISTHYSRTPGHNYFIRINDLDNYYTKAQVYTKGEIDQMFTGSVPHNRTFMIFKRSASNVTETLPSTTITWNVSTGVLDIPNGSNGWTEHPENASNQTPYLWVAYATFESLHGERVGNWDGPFCLTGENGKDGEDGKGVEFIYHLGPKGANGARPTAPEIDYEKSKNYNTNPASTDNNRIKAWWATEASQDWCPGDGSNGYWTDNPAGVDDAENEQVEWASLRRSHYDTTNEVTIWEDFCSPFIWSMWGEDGTDGDGVEYIFCVTATEAEMEVFRNLIPIKGQTYNDFNTRFPNYQTSDWYPKDGQGNANKWTDNPLSVSSNQPYEWVAIRKKNGATGEWSYFSEPKVWGLWGQKTVYETTSDIIYNNRPYTCYAFARSVDDLTTRVIKTTWEYNNQTYNQWIAEDPSRESDFYVNPLNYIITLKPKANAQNEWEIDANVTWSDSVPASNSPSEDLYLITNLIGDEEEEETAWDGPVIWGDSTGFQTEYAAETTETTAVYNKTLTLPRLDTYETADPLLDPDGDGINEDAWRTAVSNAGMGVWKDDNTIVNPVYMATCYKKANGYWSAWTVTKVKGENGEPGAQGDPGGPGQDGRDVEFIYYRTKTDDAPGIETAKYYKAGAKTGAYDQVEDALPKVSGITSTNQDPGYGGSEGKAYWHDHPAGVNETWKYEWVSTRRSYYTNGIKYWEAFYTPPTLWSKFGEDGKDGDGVEYVFWGLSEQDVQQLTSTWPTQQVSNNNTNHGQNVDPTRKDTANRSVTDPEYLPAILINNTKRQAVDNNPGIENNKYVFASMRKYTYDSVSGTSKWGEFSETKLWNEQPASAQESIILDIEDDTHPVYVDENGTILDRYMDYTGYSTDGMYLYKNLILLNCGNVSIKGDNGDVTIATLNNGGQSNNYDKVTIASPGIPVTSNGITAHVYPYWAWKYEDSNHSTVQLRVVFDKVSGQNPTLNDSFDITIKVQSADGQYVGSDILRLVPKYSDKEVELLRVPGTQRTSEEGGTTYSDSEFMFYGWYGDSYTPLSLIADTAYYFKYDDQVSWTKFEIPANNSGLTTLKNSVDGVTEGGRYFYFDRTGTFISDNVSNVNVNGAFFKIWLYNSDYSDNNHGIWTNWKAIAYVLASAFTATNDYPVDELYFGIGFDGNEPIDEANVHIIYPGKNGQPGTNGSYKKELYRRGTENSAEDSWVATWSSIGATIATLTTAGWSATKPSTTSSYPHIWMTRADVTIGQEETQVCVWETPTRITPVDGNITHTYEYLAGTIMRTSEWSAGTTGTTKYWDGNTVVSTSGGVETQSSTNEGIKYLDVVSVTTTTNGVTKTSWYKCITNHTKTSTSPATDSTNWAEFAIMGDAAFHNLLVENAAYIESLTSKQVVITDNNTIVAGMASGAEIASASGNQTVGDVRIWAGTPTTNGDLTTAPFTVDDDGAVKASNINLAGGSISGTLNIGGDGKIRSRLTESWSTHQTVIDAEGFSNSYRTTTQGYGNEVSIKDGTVVVEEGTQASGYVNQATLYSNTLGFKNVTGSTTTYTQAVTTITKIDNVNQMPITSIQCVTALPQDPSAATLYIVIPNNS